MTRITFLLTLVFSNFGCSSDESKEELVEKKNTASEYLEMGNFSYEDNSTYSGEMKFGKPHGVGQKKFSNGKSYKGQFRKGYVHGAGKMIYEKDSPMIEFTGLWDKGVKSGRGSLVLEDGSRIDGYWENDVLKYGESFSSDGTRSIGTWKKGRLSEGVLFSPVGDTLSGQFDQNGLIVSGSLRKASGEIYYGTFKDGEFDASGVWESGSGLFMSVDLLRGKRMEMEF